MTSRGMFVLRTSAFPGHAFAHATLVLALAAAACPAAFAQVASPDAAADALAVPYVGEVPTIVDHTPRAPAPPPGGGGRVIIPVYDNIVLGPDAGYFSATVDGDTVRGAMDFVSLERRTASGAPIGTPARISTMLLALDNDTTNWSMTVSVQFFGTFIDWRQSPAEVCVDPIGTAYFDITPATPHDGPVYTLDLSSIGGVSVPRGRCCVLVRTWQFSNGQPPTVPSTTGRVLFRSGPAQPLPSLGYSPNNVYIDHDGVPGIQKSDRVTFPGGTTVGNLGLALYTDEGCTIDFNGDGFVNGDDIDRLFEEINAGCPY